MRLDILAVDEADRVYNIEMQRNDKGAGVKRARYNSSLLDANVTEPGALFGDESHILYVNAQIKDDTALGQLMHDFSCTSAEEMHYQILADRVRYFKEDTEGVATMCKAMEDMRNEAVKANAIKAARSFLALRKLSYEEIANSLGLTVDEVKALDESKPA